MSGREHPTERLSAYLDDALPAGERREVEGHLESCDACARLLDDLRTLSRDLREEGTPEVPHGLETRIRRALDRERPVVVPFRRRWAIPASVAATIGSVALLVVALRFTTWEAPPPAPVLPPAVEPSVEALEPAPPAPPPAPPPARKKERSEVRRGRVAEEAEVATPPPPPAPVPEPAMPESAPLHDSVLADLEESRTAESPPAPTAGHARAGATGDETQPMRAAKSASLPGAECRAPFEPYDAALRRVTVDPERDRFTIDGFVGSLAGNIVVRDDARLERTYVVPVRRWVEFRDFLVSRGYALASTDEPVPKETDCIRVKVEFAPEPR